MIKRTSVMALVLFIVQPLMAQIKMEPAYFIDNQGKRTDGFIRNTDTQDNPKGFEFSMTADGTKERRTLGDATEFAVIGKSTFIRYEVLSDTSDQRVGKWSNQRAPEWKKQTVFLKLLVSGKARLFFWSQNDITLFYYSMNGEPPKQLVYKRYMLNADKNQYADNLEYVNDLNLKVNCNSLPMKEVSRTKYNERELVTYFVNYNKCMGDETSAVSGKGVGKGSFHMAIRPGVNFNSYTATIETGFLFLLVPFNFPSTTTGRLGVELEQVFGFGANKWAVVMEPTYQYMSGETTANNIYFPTNPYKAKLDYKSLEIPLLIKYYFFLNDDSRIYLNGGLCFDIPMGSTLTVNSQTFELSKSVNLAFGVGFSHKKLSLEARGYNTRNLLSAYLIDNSYKNFSVIVGYRLF